MAHIHTSTTRAEATAPEWLPLGAQLGELVNTWSGRSDLIAYVGPGAGGPAPACYNPQLSEVEVNVDVAFGPGTLPRMVGDLNLRNTQFEWPKASGAIFHEALHARFSRWSLEAASEALSEKAFAAINLLEESRIEAAGARLEPANTVFLRTCALEIVLADAEEGLKGLSTVRAAAQLAGLTLARVDAGVLERDDVSLINDMLEPLLGDTLPKLRSVWNRFQMHENHADATELYALANEWVEIVEEAAADEPDPEGSGRGEGGLPQEVKDLLDALAEDAGVTAIEAADAAADQQTSEQWSRQASSIAKKATEKRDHSRVSEKVFGAGTGPSPAMRTGSELQERRAPKPRERAAAVKVASMLDRAKYRERDLTEIASVTPPGRLRTRALVQGQALKAKGVMTQTEPWRRNVRTHTDEPTLTVGVLVDISGSMRAAMEPMAVTAWVMSEAARRVQARAAMVYYGQDVFATLKPGQHLTDVNVYTAPDATEKFDQAFRALDGGLNLLHGSGARLLVVVSDGVYTVDEQKKAKDWMRRCSDAGVAVLWLPFDEGGHPRSYLKGTNGVVLAGALDPADAATQIGKAAADALTKVSARAA